jgi:hypothetical protein
VQVVVMHRHLVKEMMVAAEVAVELTHFLAAAVAAVLLQQVNIVKMLVAAVIIMMEAEAVMVQLLQSQVLL